METQQQTLITNPSHRTYSTHMGNKHGLLHACMSLQGAGVLMHTLQQSPVLACLSTAAIICCTDAQHAMLAPLLPLKHISTAKLLA